GWTIIDDKLRKRDEATVRAWKEEIDTSLIFAGLFSAVLTAFNVQVYPSLQPNAEIDLQTQVLVHLSAQLSLLSAGEHFVSPVRPASANTAHPTRPIVYVNALWFSSLVLSLAAASTGIVIRQWLNHFIHPTSSSSLHGVYIHCIRWDLGIISWHVPTMLSVLPILLQLAVLLFLIGLSVLLWTLN
ncbi:hypothetical protein OBBRIDRAFT_710872, partial [Obba rivulosa]